jgi:hypothetical protein
VAETFGRIDGPLERAEETDFQGMSVRTAGEEFEDFLDFPPLRQITGFDSVGDEEFPVFKQTRFVRHFVDAVEGGPAFMVEVAGDRLVGEEHELLDQLVRFIGRLFFNPVGPALGIEEDTELGEIQIEGTLGEPLPTKGRGEVPGAVEKSVEVILGGTAQSKEGFGVSQTVAGVDDGAGETGGSGFAFGVEVDEGGVGKALFIGAEGAEAIRKTGREHGDDAVDEIHTVGPFAGLVIQSRAGFHIVGYVGDVNADLDMAVGEFPEGDGVVEIAGGVGVDGDDEVAAEIFPSSGAVGEFNGGKRFGFGEGFGGEGRGQVKFSDDGEDVDAWVGGAAEAFDKEAFGVGLAIFPIDEFRDDLVAGFGHGGAFCAGGGDVEIMEEAGVVGDDDEEAGGFLECSDHHGGAAFKNAEDASATAVRFGRASATGGGSGPAIDAGDNQIAVERGAGVFSGDVQIGRAVGRDDKGKSFRMKLDGPGDEVGGAGGYPVILPDAGDAAFFFQGCESAGNGRRGDPEAFRKGGSI